MDDYLTIKQGIKKIGYFRLLKKFKPKGVLRIPENMIGLAIPIKKIKTTDGRIITEPENTETGERSKYISTFLFGNRAIYNKHVRPKDSKRYPYEMIKRFGFAKPAYYCYVGLIQGDMEYLFYCYPSDNRI